MLKNFEALFYYVLLVRLGQERQRKNAAIFGFLCFCHSRLSFLIKYCLHYTTLFAILIVKAS